MKMKNNKLKYKNFLLLLVMAFGIIVACKSGSSSKSNVLTITLEPKSGSTVAGTATFSEKNGVVSFEAKLSGLKPGIHGIHIQSNSC